MNKVVFETALGSRLDASQMPDNPWPQICFLDSSNMLKSLVPNLNIDLAITNSTQIQAAAFCNPPTIAITSGLAIALCKLAGRIVSSGAFTNFGSTNPQWSPDGYIHTSTVNDTIKEEVFIWNKAFFPWMEDKERNVIYIFIPTSMFRFIVLHELGHVHFGHGRARNSINGIPVDGQHRAEADYKKAVISQAKETVADGYALNAMLSIFNKEYNSANLDETRAILKNRLLSNESFRLRMCLICAYVIFNLLDRRQWTFDQARMASHPPAPFRMKAIYSTALEIRYASLTEAMIKSEVNNANLIGAAILAIGLNLYPNTKWYDQVNTKEFDDHFMAIHEQMPNWIGVR